MKKIHLFIVLAAVLLSGCAAAQPERLVVNDVVETFPAGTVKYTISVSLPEGMTEAVYGGSSDKRMYESADGTYFVITEVLPRCSAEDAIRQMTGYKAEDLGMICTRNMSMPEYRFSWCTDGEHGMLTCTGIVVEDAAFCYCLSFCADEQQAKNCAAARDQVMSGFGLYCDEGF